MIALPRGRHGLSREFVARSQRERLLAAVPGSLDEHGYDRTTVSLVSARAQVSKADFYRHFASKDVCFLAAYDGAVAQVREQVLAACSERRGWADRVCAALRATLAYLAAEPARANLLLVEGLRAGPAVYERFGAAVQSFVPHLREGAPEAGGAPLPPAVGDAVVGGIASLLGRRVLAGEAADLERLFPDLAEFVLARYLGAAEARRIVSAR